MTELLVGTRKGLFVLEGEPGAPFEVTARAFAGEPVEYALRDPRSGRVLASVTSPFYGPKILYTDDPAGEWEQAERRRAARRRRRGARADLGDRARRGRRRACTPAAIPACCSRAATAAPRLELNRGALGAPDAAEAGSRAPAGCACTRSCPWPGEPDRLAVGDLRRRRVADRRRRRDAGAAATTGIVAALPARGRAGGRDGAVRAPHRSARRRGPSGCSCSSTAASTAPTTPASRGATSRAGLPSDFGFPLAIDPADPDSAYVIPLDGRHRPRHARRAACACTRRATPARAGRRAATACPPSTPT